MVIAHPVFKKFGTFLFNPIFEDNDVIVSTGHTKHQTLPNRIEKIIIKGHQYDQTIRLAAFVFRNSFIKEESLVIVEKPIEISVANTAILIIFNNMGIMGNCKILFNI